MFSASAESELAAELPKIPAKARATITPRRSIVPLLGFAERIFSLNDMLECCNVPRYDRPGRQSSGMDEMCGRFSKVCRVSLDTYVDLVDNYVRART